MNWKRESFFYSGTTWARSSANKQKKNNITAYIGTITSVHLALDLHIYRNM